MRGLFLCAVVALSGCTFDSASSGPDRVPISGNPPVSPASCDEQYGAADGYELCDTTPTTCSFNATLDRAISCDDACEQFGGTCVNAFSNGADRCNAGGEEPCDDVGSFNNICVCSRP